MRGRLSGLFVAVAALGFIAPAHTLGSPSAERELISLYGSLEVVECGAEPFCLPKDTPPEPLTIEMKGSGGELRGQTRITAGRDELFCLADVIAEKSGPYYTLRVSIRDTPDGSVKAEQLTLVTKVRNLNMMMLRSYRETSSQRVVCVFKWAGK